MTASQEKLIVKPIGFVSNDIKEPEMRNWENVISEIVVDAALTEALDGIEDFSHILILFWAHKLDANKPMTAKVHPQGKKGIPPVGRFASRSPHRYNPIGKTTVKLLERRGNILKVQGLDAIDGTPVIDIKPYMPHYDSVKDARVPQWVDKLHAKNC